MTLPLAPADCDFASAAALIADRSRAAMLAALLDGRAMPAGELARVARIAATTASEHLARLSAAGLLVAEPRGRHRYYRLAGRPVARALEALALVARPRPAAGAKDAWSGTLIQRARSCYDHLAGRLGVLVSAALVDQRALTHDERGYLPGPSAPERFGALGVDVSGVAERARRSRRPIARSCLDWSERRPHLAGALGASLLDALLEREWLERLTGTRALKLTGAGRRGLRGELGVVLI